MPNNTPISDSIVYRESSKRATEKPAQSMECKLKRLLDNIIEESNGHLSRVRNILPYFDDHSVKHSEKVLENIDKLLGEETIKKLSVYDLFILAASAYLHDWGMALTDYENAVLLLAEKAPLPVEIKDTADYRKLIQDNKEAVFGTQLQDALQKNILPTEEAKLYDYLAELYREYQKFRNGYKEKYQKTREEKLDGLNKSIRMDFIRDKHPERSAKYVEHWSKRIKIKDEDVSLSKVLSDVAKVVRSHGMSSEYIEKELTVSTKYQTIDDQKYSNVANLQFASMLLRLGDIVHFTSDRAPASLRREIKFDIPESIKYWKVKADVSNRITKEGNRATIVFNAACEIPQDYCYLEEYIQWINNEIDIFKQLQPRWDERYQMTLAPVEDEVEPFDGSFETKPDMKFTLNQNRILDLLMGANLYANPYSCLRELYQNSLDACRCAIARRKSQGEKTPECTIEFGVKTDEGGKYLYCLDDGKGMSRHIIENYFLKIGNSYYKSNEFYETCCGFTPTSQFGIGILSCFMIGTRLEVVTKEYEGELISFGVDGPQETFYYWNEKYIKSDDKDIFGKRMSGTLVRIYLKDQYADELDTGALNRMELLKCGIRSKPWIKEDKLDDDAREYMDLWERWQHHIYGIIFDFVQIPFPDIKVQVFFEDQIYPIEARPGLYKVDLDEYEKDKKVVEAIGYSRKWYSNIGVESYPIEIHHANFVYHNILCLPKAATKDYGYNEYTHASFCVDGVRIDGKWYDKNTDVYDNWKKAGWILDALTCRVGGIFNFVGEHKPSIKVDRCAFVEGVYIEEVELFFEKYIDEIIRIIQEHIRRYNIGNDIQRYQDIWFLVIDRLPEYLQDLLRHYPDHFDYPQIKSAAMEMFFGTDEDVPTVFSKKSMALPVQSGLALGHFDVFLIKKLSAIQSVSITQDGRLQLLFGELPTFPFFSRNGVLIGLPKDEDKFADYDIVDNYFPFVSHRFSLNMRFNLEYFTNTHGFIFNKDEDGFVKSLSNYCRANLFLNKGDYGEHYGKKLQQWGKKGPVKCPPDFEMVNGGVYRIGRKFKGRYLLSDDRDIISLYFSDNRLQKSYSVITTERYLRNRVILVVEGYLTRKKMEILSELNWPE